MEKTIKIGGRDLRIRGLTWGEKKRLKAEGHNLAKLDPYADNDELVEKTIEIVCGDRAFLDDLPSSEVYRLFGEINRLSYLTEDEAKNSNGRQPSPPTTNSGAAESAGPQG